MEETKTFAISNMPRGGALWESIAGNFSHCAQIVNEFVDDALSNYAAHAADTRLSREVRMTVRDEGDTVYVTVEDGGTGIADLSNALTLAGMGAQETILNEHGFGLKHALASANPENNDWSIVTCTEEDAKTNRSRKVSAPYMLSKDGFSGEYLEGWDGTLGATGTIIRFGCSRRMFETLQDGRHQQAVKFVDLVMMLAEELGFTYGPLLRDNRLRIRLLAENSRGEQLKDVVVTPLNPEWDEEEPPVELEPASYDLGGGEVKITCKYGQIIPSEENNRYYRGNMASSGVELRVNGRAVTFGLFKSIWKCEKHPSQNLFLAQINLETNCAGAVPPTRTAKNGFREGDARLESLYRWIRCAVPKPDRQTAAAVERALFTQLAGEKERTLRSPCRVSTEEFAYQSLGEKVRMDLFTNENGLACIYEGKKDATQPRDIYQLRMYWDGCVVDGICPREAILIASRHPDSVRKLVDITNRMCGPDGKPYNFLLETWRDEGIEYPPAA